MGTDAEVKKLRQRVNHTRGRLSQRREKIWEEKASGRGSREQTDGQGQSSGKVIWEKRQQQNLKQNFRKNCSVL